MRNNSTINTVWLTDFCDSIRLFVSIVMVQIVVIIYALSFLSLNMEFLRKLSILTLLAQLVGIVLLVILCKSKEFFNKIGVIFGVALLIVLVVAVTTLLSRIIGYFDLQLSFHLFENQASVDLLNIKLSVSSVMLTLALVRYFFIQDQWQQQVQKLSNAKLNALQARIKPHFLFNSLNSIASLISIDAKQAETAVSDFSSLMRSTFAHIDKNISIKDELDLVQKYLAIEKLRLGDRLAFSLNCDKALLMKQIPILCIQPLVENAVIHGIQPLENGGEISISIQGINKNIEISVSNPYTDYQASHQSNGMALINIKERLQLQYGNQAKMKINKTANTYHIKITIVL